MPSWAGSEFPLTAPGSTSGRHLGAPESTLWPKGSLTQGAQISPLHLLQLLAPFHAVHLHCGCSRTTSCWELSTASASLTHHPQISCSLDKLAHFAALLRQYCKTQFGLQPLIPRGCAMLSAQVTHVPDMQASAGRVQSNPGILVSSRQGHTGPMTPADILSTLQQCHFERGCTQQFEGSSRHLSLTSWKAMDLNCAWTCPDLQSLLIRAH